jgi:hypothetical protein
MVRDRNVSTKYANPSRVTPMMLDLRFLAHANQVTMPAKCKASARIDRIHAQ